jgi:hypothetical protein
MAAAQFELFDRRHDIASRGRIAVEQVRRQALSLEAVYLTLMGWMGPAHADGHGRGAALDWEFGLDVIVSGHNAAQEKVSSYNAPPSWIPALGLPSLSLRRRM